MYVEAIEIHGLRGAEGYSARGLERMVELPPGPAGVAVADALELAAAVLDKEALADRLVGLGIAASTSDVEVLGEGPIPDQVRWRGARGVVPLLDGVERHATVALTLALDPPLFGELRQHALRDPRLAAGLGDGASLGVTVGWLFADDLQAAATAVLSVRVGGLALSMAEPPPWLLPLLGRIGRRFRRVTEVPPDAAAAALHEASLSPDPVRRSGAARAIAAASGPPWHLPPLGFVRAGTGVRAGFGADLLSARQLARSNEVLALCLAALVDAPDVLVIDDTVAHGAGRVDWLRERIDGDDATLEQVWLPGEP